MKLMKLFKKTYQQHFEEAINILNTIKDKITDESDCVLTSYENAKALRNDIEKYILHFRNSDQEFLDET